MVKESSTICSQVKHIHICLLISRGDTRWTYILKELAWMGFLIHNNWQLFKAIHLLNSPSLISQLYPFSLHCNVASLSFTDITLAFALESWLLACLLFWFGHAAPERPLCQINTGIVWALATRELTNSKAASFLFTSCFSMSSFQRQVCSSPVEWVILF